MRHAEALAASDLPDTYMQARARPKCREGKGGVMNSKGDVWVRDKEVRVGCGVGA